jgi:hypothetical protein
MARDRNVASDRAGVGPAPDTSSRLVPMRKTKDFEIGKGEPDVRGWAVRTLGGRLLGHVDDLLVDADARTVVMLEIQVQDSDRHALAPLRAEQLDRDQRTVLLDSADLDRGGDLPTYRRGQPDSDEEARQFDDRFRRAYPEGEDATRDADVSVRRQSEGDADEVVVERRPVVVEEVVVRRKNVDESE